MASFSESKEVIEYCLNCPWDECWDCLWEGGTYSEGIRIMLGWIPPWAKKIWREYYAQQKEV